MVKYKIIDVGDFKRRRETAVATPTIFNDVHLKNYLYVYVLFIKLKLKKLDILFYTSPILNKLMHYIQFYTIKLIPYQSEETQRWNLKMVEKHFCLKININHFH